MNDPSLHTLILPELPFDKREILRYAQIPKNAPVPESLPLDICLGEVSGKIRCRAVWARFPLSASGSELDLGFSFVSSRNLAHRLEGCCDIVLFACTAGYEMDRMIGRASLRSPVNGLLMHAIGAERVEGACDELCRILGGLFPEYRLTERFSPGYGDLPLELQRDVLRALDSEKTVGITLTDSLLMQPAKSVTAIIGLKEKKHEVDG